MPLFVFSLTSKESNNTPLLLFNLSFEKNSNICLLLLIINKQCLEMNYWKSFTVFPEACCPKYCFLIEACALAVVLIVQQRPHIGNMYK